MTLQYILDNNLNPITGWSRDIIQDNNNNNEDNDQS